MAFGPFLYKARMLRPWCDGDLFLVTRDSLLDNTILRFTYHRSETYISLTSSPFQEYCRRDVSLTAVQTEKGTSTPQPQLDRLLISSVFSGEIPPHRINISIKKSPRKSGCSSLCNGDFRRFFRQLIHFKTPSLLPPILISPQRLYVSWCELRPYGR